MFLHLDSFLFFLPQKWQKFFFLFFLVKQSRFAFILVLLAWLDRLDFYYSGGFP